MEDEKVIELAKSLKNNGLAASDYEAMEKAKAILGVQIQKVEPEKESFEKTGEPFADTPEAHLESQEKKEGLFSHLKEKLHHEEEKPIASKTSQPDYDISREELTVNDLMREVGVNPVEEHKELEKEEGQKIHDVKREISEIREEISDEIKHPKERKMEEIKEEVKEVKQEMQEISEEEQQDVEEKKELEAEREKNLEKEKEEKEKSLKEGEVSEINEFLEDNKDN